MIFELPKVFLDTQIPSDAAKGRISAGDWAKACSYLRHTTQYCISALTITELLRGMADGDESYFEQHRRRLAILLAPSGNPEIFDFAPYFVARQFGFAVTRAAHLEDDFLGTVRYIVSVKSKADLLDGVPVPGKPGVRLRIALDRLTNEMKTMKDRYVTHLEYLKGKRKLRVDPNDWAAGWLKGYGVSMEAGLVLKVKEALSAAYEFEMAVSDLARNKNFDLARNFSDLIDGQQLCYLADPLVVFVTNDSDHKKRIKNSPQAGRVKTFDELLCHAEAKTPLV